ncbi:hypothetical protein Sjap_014986 [Stephania japonica]|uniref:BHLH domain-containing protein n=1 Tax=Stephania japonica TaxID=461633 RepID=A0AAP0II98_9MAGN
MCGKKEDDDQQQGECSHQSVQISEEQLFLQQQQQQQQLHQVLQQQYNNSTSILLPSEVSPILQWSLPQMMSNTFNNNHLVHQFSTNPVHRDPIHHHHHHHHHDPFLVPPPPLPSSSSYGGLFNRRVPSALQFAYDGSSSDHHHHHHHQLRILSDPVLGASAGGSSAFALQAELGKLTAQEIMDAKALAASKSHSEAERRRRERINNHLAKLRSMLPSTTKTDKASLLAEVIQHVKELKRQTSVIAEASPVPTENDELVVDDALDEDGRFIIRASLCCEDRSDLLPDLIKTLKALRLRTLKAEITTLGGRVKNVLVITGEEESKGDGSSDIDNQQRQQQQQPLSISSIQEALRAVMERSSSDDSSSGSVKRQRTTNITLTN